MRSEEFVLTGADLITVDTVMPRARSMHVRDGRIVSVSASSMPASCAARSARRIARDGAVVVPGFIEPHAHVHAIGERLLTLDLGPRAVASIADIVDAIRQQVLAHPEPCWLRGRGYDEFHLLEKRHPHRRDLDAAAPAYPVRLTHRSGHAHVLNSAALALAGIGRGSEDPPGGIIERDPETGEPTGLLFGMHETIARTVPPLAPHEAARAIALASDSLVAVGITTVHDTSARNDLRRLESFRHWSRRGLLRPRLRMAIGWRAFDSLDARDLRFATGDERDDVPGDGLVDLAGVKVIVHEATGRLEPPQAELDAIVERIHRAGWQAIVHAVEPTTIAAACSAIERAIERMPRAKAHRHRIEHCSVCPPALARRLAAAGITVVTHPAFVHFNGARYLETMREDELRDLYPLATLRAAGVAAAASSDAPVAPPDPLAGLRAAITRRTAEGRTLGAEQAVAPAEALRMCTIDAARAACVEIDRGCLRAGALADFVVLDRNPISPPCDRSAKVLETWIGGECVYRASEV